MKHSQRYAFHDLPSRGSTPVNACRNDATSEVQKPCRAGRLADMKCLTTLADYFHPKLTQHDIPAPLGATDRTPSRVTG
jgi:hypothetical protein